MMGFSHVLAAKALKYHSWPELLLGFLQEKDPPISLRWPPQLASKLQMME